MTVLPKKPAKEAPWGPDRLAVCVRNVTEALVAIQSKNGKAWTVKLVSILTKGAKNAGADGQAKLLEVLQAAASTNDVVRAQLSAVVFMPSQLELKNEVSPSVQLLVLKALYAANSLGGPKPSQLVEDEKASSDSEDEEGKWRPSRVEKFLQKLIKMMEKIDKEGKKGQIARHMARGGWKTDEEGKCRIVSCLQKISESSSSAKAFLHTLGNKPFELGLNRVPNSARALALRAIGGDLSQLPRNNLAIHHGVTCDGCDISPITGIRYKSNTIHNFDLCASCFSSPNRNWSPQEFTAIERPFMPRGLMMHRGRGRGGGCGRGWWAEGKEEKPQLRLVSDVTAPDGTRLMPGQAFTKIWRVRNSGSLPWDPHGAGLMLLHVGGDELGAPKATPQCPDGPPAINAVVDLSVDLVAPMEPGCYTSYFRMACDADPEPVRFGRRVWVQVMVINPEAVAESSEQALIAGIAGLKPLPANDSPANNGKGAGEGAANSNTLGDWVITPHTL